MNATVDTDINSQESEQSSQKSPPIRVSMSRYSPYHKAADLKIKEDTASNHRKVKLVDAIVLIDCGVAWLPEFVFWMLKWVRFYAGVLVFGPPYGSGPPNDPGHPGDCAPGF